MATIIKRGEKYQCRVRLKGQTFSQNFTTKRDAQAWGREQEAAIQRGQVSDAKVTLAEVIDRYIEEVNPEPDRQTKLKWYKDHMGHKRLTDCRKADFVNARKEVAKLRNKRTGEPLSVASVNRYTMAMSAVLTRAVDEWFLLETNPARIKQLAEKNARDRILTDDEQTRLIDAAEQSEEHSLLPMMLMAMGSGARAGELTNLRWGDVDLEQGIAILRDTKNGDSRAIPVQGYALDALKEMRNRDGATPIGSSYVFRNNTGRTPFHYHKAWDAARSQAGIKDFRFHDLRHTAASLVAMAGRSLGEVGALLGHRSTQTTKRYSHYAKDHVLQMGEVIAVRRK
jgi:integrase